MDSRTGTQEGSMIELTDDELNKVPFNVFLKKMGIIDDKENIEKASKDKLKEDLRSLLIGKGLSINRTSKVLDKYSSLEELTKNASKAGIDELTDEFLKKEFGLKPKQNKKESDN